jgi:hypothetical protein
MDADSDGSIHRPFLQSWGGARSSNLHLTGSSGGGDMSKVANLAKSQTTDFGGGGTPDHFGRANIPKSKAGLPEHAKRNPNSA